MTYPELEALLARQVRDRSERAARYTKNAIKSARKNGEPQITADRMSAYNNLLLADAEKIQAALPELLAKARAHDELLATTAYEVVERGCHENFDGAIYGLPNESIGKRFRLLAVEE